MACCSAPTYWKSSKSVILLEVNTVFMLMTLLWKTPTHAIKRAVYGVEPPQSWNWVMRYSKNHTQLQSTLFEPTAAKSVHRFGLWACLWKKDVNRFCSKLVTLNFRPRFADLSFVSRVHVGSQVTDVKFCGPSQVILEEYLLWHCAFNMTWPIRQWNQ